ncbi:hypothetical protein LXG23DRAFT_34070 [Yarrowia lipolytica]|nr:hypothetical protein LXG23DRAFT_34070 [Yarrowia lipolytica]
MGKLSGMFRGGGAIVCVSWFSGTMYLALLLTRARPETPTNPTTYPSASIAKPAVSCDMSPIDEIFKDPIDALIGLVRTTVWDKRPKVGVQYAQQPVSRTGVCTTPSTGRDASTNGYL